MLLILSPSKTLDYETPYKLTTFTQPEFIRQSEVLIKILKRYSAKQVAELMEVSDKLATLNAERFKTFSTPFTPDNARQAILAFKGDVYTGIEVSDYKKAEFAFAQVHMRILSGLYGLLRPLDLMQPYRLEMGRPLKTSKGVGLYRFWGGQIAQALNEELAQHQSKFLINLASVEYAKAVDRKIFDYPVIDIVFKENDRIVALFAKQARGMMANAIIRNKWDRPEQLKDFSENRYRFDKKRSGDSRYVFVRKTS